MAHRQKLRHGGVTAKTMDYTLKRWARLQRYIVDGELSIDRNGVENQIWPIAFDQENWLFAGRLSAGHRSVASLRLLHAAKLNAHGPH